ncbi:MAG: hypothetical protein NZ534_00465 [Bacteroidia bacterium]|nr:hypothetical protein [Bacteroidia bacterium]
MYRMHYHEHAFATSFLTNPMESLYAATFSYQHMYAADRFAMYLGGGLYTSFSPGRPYNALSRERYYFNRIEEEPLPPRGDTTMLRYIHYSVNNAESSGGGMGFFLTIGIKLRIPPFFSVGLETSPVGYGFSYISALHGEWHERIKRYADGSRRVEERSVEAVILQDARARRVVWEYPVYLIYPRLYFSVSF